MSNLTLVAPIKGWVAPLDEVPDPVFAERILGDGLAIDPTDATVHAPCDAVVASVARHAVTLRAANGAEILIHIGLETVTLHGQGFVTHVREGQSVRTGDALITFDLDFLATKAKSLISPVVVTNGDAFAIVRRSTDRETGLGEFLMELRPLAEQTVAAAGAGEATRDVVVRLAHGIHARPAAQISAAAKRFGGDVELSVRGRRVNAKSIAALMSLGVRKDEMVTITARGADAVNAVDVLADLIDHGIEEAPEAPPPPAPVPVPPADLPSNTLRGVCGAPGLVIGKALQLRATEFAVAEAGRGVTHEAAALNDALTQVRLRLDQLASGGNRQRREILSAHLALLDDPELMRQVHSAIESGKSAAFAWREAIRGYAAAFRAIDDVRMRERVGDLVDLERQVMAALCGDAGLDARSLAPDTILIADELLPSELAAVGAIAGFATAAGGPTSHVAILAAGMSVPALVSLGEKVLDIADGTTLFLDTEAALLHIEPDANRMTQARAAIARRSAGESAARAHALEECRTADGTRIEVLANLGAGADEAVAAVAAGAEGCGLLRTEFLFLDRETPPSEDEQAAAYQAIAAALNGRPFKVRTFDIGGDKPVPYLPLPAEENPALGLRGVRAALWRSDLLKTQLAAILRVTPAPRIMLPMVASLAELHAVRVMLDELGAPAATQLGVMIETPASAVLAAQLAREADFFSIGTNDLTQYTLAMDRGHAQLAAQIDAFHPAVLSLIAQAASGAAAQGKPVAVCGGLAGDPLAAALLIGLGVRELSMPAAAIARVKGTVRALTLEQCRAAATEALQQSSPQDVRAVATKYLPAGATP
ncbi:MAG: phosphoenolpyruvate--protein phosphotransferase [Alphaproteobacteria bacterium]|nr:phosphoenolpyruvate--protein phosphotransferase [Alphaproteobacteria bacterium]MBL7096547.1 phosphoenolpyruvate--protein phosphotransferase [Alphaproteobacteria bacterium]